MIKLNPNLKNLKKNYLFVDIQKKTDKFISENPDAERNFAAVYCVPGGRDYPPYPI